MKNRKAMRRRERFLKEWGEPVAADHGATISEVMIKTRNEEVEYISFFSKDERKIFELTNNCPTGVALGAEDEELIQQYPGGTLVHNHTEEESVAFTPEDLAYLATGLCQKIVVVTSTLYYTMEAPERRHWIDMVVLWLLERRFYRENSASEASFNFCLKVATHLGWKFKIKLMPDMSASELTSESIDMMAEK